MKKSNYEKDFFKWTKDQSQFLKKRDFDHLDIDNLIEEIESLGRSEKRTLESYLANLFLHLLKIEFQPEKHSKSWDHSVKFSKHKAIETYKENPSLKQHLKTIFKDAYYSARWKAIEETNSLPSLFPEKCPWSIEEILSE